ncbi:MAG: hypothetical protein QOH13_680 [Thermoleophilaceae bacterium]|jgi:uncharacterized RDD family membrane protein YckC|nr:hypothetical protein [Thermoleophilaceae bacterium]
MQHSDVLGRRIGAALIDIGIVFVLMLLVGGIFGNDAAPDAPASARYGALDRVLILSLVFAYFWGTETVWAQTLGKRALGIRVVGLGGSKATAGAILVRTVLRIVDFLPAFYIVGLIAILATGPRRQRVGDLAARTRVVLASEQPDEPPSAAPPSPTGDDDVLSQIMR